jgi:hypothetical protein
MAASESICSMSGNFSCCSLNMRGFSSGFTMLNELSLSRNFLAVQEHWLDSSSMSKLSLINNKFQFYGVSGMFNSESKGLMKGSTPYGGVAFLWHNDLAKQIKIVDFDDSGRCLAACINIDSRVILVINV